METLPIVLRFVFLICAFTSVAAAQLAPTKKDIPAIAKEVNGSIVSIVMSNKDGKPIAQGSGFVVSKDGLIVTNYHVIAEGDSAVAKLPDGILFVVDGVLAADKERDIAIIKAHHGEDFRTVPLGNSDRVQVGEEVIAIGNPLSLESTVSNGIVSGIRSIKEEGGKYLQITAPISPGSSGGPLFNMVGEVIGITSMGLRGGENLNFAIPINEAKRLMRNRSAKLQALPNEPDSSDAVSAPAPKVIANERLRAFSECQLEHNPLDYTILHYSVECARLIKSDFKEWAVQQNLDHQAESLAQSEVIAYRQRGELYSHLEYNGNWSSWLGSEAVERIEKLNSQPYAVRVAVLKDSSTLVDKYVLHFYEATNP